MTEAEHASEVGRKRPAVKIGRIFGVPKVLADCWHDPAAVLEYTGRNIRWWWPKIDEEINETDREALYVAAIARAGTLRVRGSVLSSCGTVFLATSLALLVAHKNLTPAIFLGIASSAISISFGAWLSSTADEMHNLVVPRYEALPDDRRARLRTSESDVSGGSHKSACVRCDHARNFEHFDDQQHEFQPDFCEAEGELGSGR